MAWVEFSDSAAEKQRIGVIGTSFGMNHVQSATIVPEATLVAACDLRDEFRAPIEKMGAKFYTDYRRMLDAEKLDGVVVAVPNHLHAREFADGIQLIASGAVDVLALVGFVTDLDGVQEAYDQALAGKVAKALIKI